MKKTTIAVIIYVIGLVFAALMLGLWDADTNMIKASIGFVWTIIFLIALFYADKHDQE
tara:strand:+ start:330 stop:503 length:174 start_codon:yes stop_codon:yes gene_type:complete